MKRTSRPIGVALAAAIGALVFAACGSRTGVLIEQIAPSDASLEADVIRETGPEGSQEAEPGDASREADAPNEADGPTPFCKPRSCAQLGYDCGENGDGCGGLLQCGTCPVPEICGVAGFSKCGGGGGLGPDGGPLCTPTTCTALGYDCGPAGNGCGGLLECGTCQSPLVCGAQVPGRCGASCSGLCLQQVQCDTGTTSVSGTVVAGTLPEFGSPDPIYNAVVYVPNAKVQPFLPGVACNQCAADVSGEPLVATQTAADGTFTLNNVPVGANIPLVIQLGRWRRQITIPSVAPCTNTALTADQTRLPRNHTEGDIPLTAIATGLADSIECVVMKMGVDQAEFTQPSGTGRIQLYQSTGADDGPGTPPAENLWDSATTLATYDQVLLPCEGSPIMKLASDQQNIVDYTSAGGRVFTTHYGYTWLFNISPFSGTANWDPTMNANATQTGILDTSSTDGANFSAWLGDVGALSGPGQIALEATRQDVDSVIAPTTQLIFATSPEPQTLQLSFYTPVGQPMAQQCGRVVFSDFHVVDAMTMGLTFPAECDMSPMTAQEKALEFMLFDIASCIPAPGPPCASQTCGQQGFNCGPAGDGCGNEIQCGSCTSPKTCGGGGIPGQCGFPDAGTCIPKTCAGLGYDCGTNGDGCGGVLQCGTCTPPQECGGGGSPSVCGI